MRIPVWGPLVHHSELDKHLKLDKRQSCPGPFVNGKCVKCGMIGFIERKEGILT